MPPAPNRPRRLAPAIAVLGALAAVAFTARSEAQAQSRGGASALATPTPSSAVEESIVAREPQRAASRLANPFETRAAPGSEARDSREPDTEESNPFDQEARPANVPRIELGYSLYSLSDGESDGRVNAGSFGGYFQTGALRLGAYAELGKRSVRLGIDDVVVRAVALAGYQYRLRHFVPYLTAVATYGWLIEQGTGSPRSAALPGGGVEFGVDLRMGAVFVGVAAAWTRIRMRGESQDLFLLRFRAGV